MHRSVFDERFRVSKVSVLVRPKRCIDTVSRDRKEKIGIDKDHGGDVTRQQHDGQGPARISRTLH